MPEHAQPTFEPFPPTSDALEYPNGLLAVGGDLSPARLIAAYERGIFPWYETPRPIMWWTPDPRSILLPHELHISRSLRKTLRSNSFALSCNTMFEQVMRLCAAERSDGPGTWITPAMLSAYAQLHERGIARSIEIHNDSGELVGGLYGIALGRAFFGESMFSLQTDASKVALVALVSIMQRGGYTLIDCQVESEHLNSLGARNVSRVDFEQRLAHTVHCEPEPDAWRLPAHCGDLM
ncbi:MAG: leucyl/phenylalanyl-tRNA--protein transferase [Halioglobus sp.]